MTHRFAGQIYLLGILLVLLGACARNDLGQPNIYPVDSLLHAQAEYLSAHKATLAKVTRLGLAENEVNVIPGSTLAWEKELEIFKALDNINKPVNRDLYHIENFADSRSNLQVKAITTTADLSVKYLKVYYQGQPRKLKKLVAEYNESNSLYESVRVMTLEFQEVDRNPVLTTYTVVGGQKMVMSDTVQYAINGSLKLSN